MTEGVEEKGAGGVPYHFIWSNSDPSYKNHVYDYVFKYGYNERDQWSNWDIRTNKTVYKETHSFKSNRVGDIRRRRFFHSLFCKKIMAMYRIVLYFIVMKADRSEIGRFQSKKTRSRIIMSTVSLCECTLRSVVIGASFTLGHFVE